MDDAQSKRPPFPAAFVFAFPKENGAGEAIRTPDPNLGKVVLYP